MLSPCLSRASQIHYKITFHMCTIICFKTYAKIIYYVNIIVYTL